MNLRIKKEGENTRIDLVDKNGDVTDFDYVAMIKLIYAEKAIENADFVGEFEEDERRSFSEMINDIKKIVVPEQH